MLGDRPFGSLSGGLACASAVSFARLVLTSCSNEGAVSISDLVSQGYVFYRRPKYDRFDCLEMRSIEEHFWHLAVIIGSLVLPENLRETTDPRVISREWSLVAQWLRLAAGLRYVDIDRGFGDPYPMLCSTAADYDDARNETASLQATEMTRLQYAWNAVERLLKILELPAVLEANGNFNAATMLLKAEWGERPLPQHYECVLRHLLAHAEGDPDLSGNSRLQAAFTETPWRGRSGLLLAAANQMRHVPAHGDIEVREPESWGNEDPGESRVLPAALHAPLLASRALALSVQMLLVAARPAVALDSWDAPEEEGWWVLQDGQWEQALEPAWATVVEQAHLQPHDAELDG